VALEVGGSSPLGHPTKADPVGSPSTATGTAVGRHVLEERDARWPTGHHDKVRPPTPRRSSVESKLAPQTKLYRGRNDVPCPLQASVTS
jgi:hypothetical protein